MKLYIEYNIKGVGEHVFSSDIKEATEEEIKEFKNKKCNHEGNDPQLIYDVKGYIYDLRYCGVCEKFLGGI